MFTCQPSIRQQDCHMQDTISSIQRICLLAAINAIIIHLNRLQFHLWDSCTWWKCARSLKTTGCGVSSIPCSDKSGKHGVNTRIVVVLHSCNHLEATRPSEIKAALGGRKGTTPQMGFKEGEVTASRLLLLSSTLHAGSLWLAQASVLLTSHSDSAWKAEERR